MLDSILAFAAVDAAQADGASDYSAQESLPLARIGDGADWVWQASALHITYAADPTTVSMARPFQYFDWVSDMGTAWARTKKNAISQGSGPMKAFLMKQNIAWVRQCTAWCVGERDQVASLLEGLNAIGPLVRNGWGRIAEVKVVSDPDGATRWNRRILPLSLSAHKTDEHALGTSVLRAPYWERSREQEVWDYIGAA
jgi:CRISPR type IV-associated protein Csf3